VPTDPELATWDFDVEQLARTFRLSWRHYEHLTRRTRSADERTFYETEAL